MHRLSLLSALGPNTKPVLEKKYLDLPGGFVYGRMCTVENCPKDDCQHVALEGET